MSELSHKERDFVLHVLVSNLINLNKMNREGMAGWIDVAVELPCQTIRTEFGRKFKPTDMDPSILSCRKYSKDDHMCRAFTADDTLVDAILHAPNVHDLAVPAVNLFDGEP
jgi:hypothetical protein